MIYRRLKQKMITGKIYHKSFLNCLKLTFKIKNMNILWWKDIYG